jgi:hypothetical protein
VRDVPEDAWENNAGQRLPSRRVAALGELQSLWIELPHTRRRVDEDGPDSREGEEEVDRAVPAPNTITPIGILIGEERSVEPRLLALPPIGSSHPIHRSFPCSK